MAAAYNYLGAPMRGLPYRKAEKGIRMFRQLVNIYMNLKTRLHVLLRRPVLAQRLDALYYARRDPLIQTQILRLRDGERLLDVLRGFNGNLYDERVCEYPYFVHWMLSKEKGLDILDVGCVLNNKLVSNFLRDRCGNVCLLNAVKETGSAVQNPLQYEVSSLLDAFPEGRRFPLVTCLSTIEHIGFDNSQYGESALPRYYKPTVQPLLESVQKLADLTAPGGNLLISFPYGFRETLIHPVTFKVASQVFDFDSATSALDVLEGNGFSTTLAVFEADDTGWKQVVPAECNGRYAHGISAARAVAFITGARAA
jgi:hypothetical protein